MRSVGSQRRDLRERPLQERRGEARSNVRERRRVPPQSGAQVRPQRPRLIQRGGVVITCRRRERHAQRERRRRGVAHRGRGDERVRPGRRAQRRERGYRHRRAVRRAASIASRFVIPRFMGAAHIGVCLPVDAQAHEPRLHTERLGRVARDVPRQPFGFTNRRNSLLERRDPQGGRSAPAGLAPS